LRSGFDWAGDDVDVWNTAIRNSAASFFAAAKTADDSAAAIDYDLRWVSKFRSGTTLNSTRHFTCRQQEMEHPHERRSIHPMRESGVSDIPQDFIDALADFDNQRFVSMETALNETPAGA